MATRALLPLAVVALLTFEAGTFTGAATPGGALLHHTLVLGFCLLAAPLRPGGPSGAARALDPLRLGRPFGWLPLTLLAIVALATWSSPVPRAGRVGLLLLPAYLLLPTAAARCWTRPEARRLAASGFSALVLAVSLVALIQWQVLGSARTALPLGHHLLLAGWLVLVLPVALAPLRHRGVERRLAAAAGLAGLSALAASRSLIGALALGAELLVLAALVPRFRRWAPLALLPMIPFLPRLARFVVGFDPSALARAAYLEAGWAGAAARPWTGWGPGATPWTIAEWVRPIAGRNPPSEVIGDLHSLPIHLLYEIGWPGLVAAVATAGVFFVRRLSEVRAREERAGSDEGLAALLGLIGFGVVCLATAPLAVPALPATLAVVAGMAIAARGARSGQRARGGRSLGVAATLGLAYVLPAAVLLVPIDRAHLHYQRAIESGSEVAALAELGRAVALDPEFPLYRARRAWLAARQPDGAAAAVDDALEAARAAKWLAPLWLGAGEVAAAADHPAAAEAFATAQRLDPLSPLAAFHAATTASPRGATLFGVRAVTGDRRFAHALWWHDHPELAARVSASAGVPIPLEVSPGAERFRLGLTLDRVPALSFSLYAFRRTPWMWTLAPFEIALPARDQG